MMAKEFYGTDSSVFKNLIGYSIGDVSEMEDETIIRFDKDIENITISKEIMIGDDGIFQSDDYVLYIAPKDEGGNP